MIDIHKKIVLDDNGEPSEVIIPWNEYQKIEELLGLDLGEKAINALREARRDRESGKKKAYIDLRNI